MDMLHRALETATPEIFNSDQGSQFTSDAFTGALRDHGIRISMDGRGRAFDNIFVERLWRTVKYEEVFLKDYDSVRDARDNLRRYFEFYNTERPHQALGYNTPWDMYTGCTGNRSDSGGGKCLIRPGVQITGPVLSHEYPHGAPSGHTHGDVHLKKTKNLS